MRITGKVSGSTTQGYGFIEAKEAAMSSCNTPHSGRRLRSPKGQKSSLKS